MSNVWALITDEMSAAAVTGVALRSGASVQALVFGQADLANRVATLGATEVIWYSPEGVLPEAMAGSVAEQAQDEKPLAVIASDQATARSLLGAIAVATGAAVAGNVIAVDATSNPICVEHLVADGEAVEVMEASGPVVCTISDGLEEAEPVGAAPISEGSFNQDCRMKVVATNAEGEGAAGLQHAERVVGVGLGIGAKENLALVEELADAMGAEIACTLPLCDNYHWFEHNRVVGTSTQKISPRLYLSFGSSGAPQHMTGVRASKVIAAVNNDPEAPIFRECTYGIVGDVMKILPAFIAALK